MKRDKEPVDPALVEEIDACVVEIAVASCPACKTSPNAIIDYVSHKTNRVRIGNLLRCGHTIWRDVYNLVFTSKQLPYWHVIVPHKQWEGRR